MRAPRFRRGSRRPGIALLIALVTMSLVGALAAGLLLAAMRERRDGADAIRRVRALAAAESGAAELLAEGAWPAAWLATPARGAVGVREYRTGDGALDSVRVLRLSLSTFLVASRGIAGVGASQARRRIGVLLDLRVPELAPRAALTAAGGVAVAAGSEVNGSSAAPPGWECAFDDAEPSIAAVAVSPTAVVDTTACDSSGCLRGAIPIVRDTAVADPAAWTHPGEVDRSVLLSVARPLPAGTTIADAAPSLDRSGTCDTAAVRNLGDPRRALGIASPCAGWLPVVHSPGDLHLSGGTGQGVLLVDGDLHLERGASFAGLAIVRGSFRSSGNSSFVGAVIASTATLDQRSTVRYSRCAVTSALTRIAHPVLARQWRWMELW